MDYIPETLARFAAVARAFSRVNTVLRPLPPCVLSLLRTSSVASLMRSCKPTNTCAPGDATNLLQTTAEAYFGATRMCCSQFSLNGAQMASLEIT